MNNEDSPAVLALDTRYHIKDSNGNEITTIDAKHYDKLLERLYDLESKISIILDSAKYEGHITNADLQRTLGYRL